MVGKSANSQLCELSGRLPQWGQWYMDWSSSSPLKWQSFGIIRSLQLLISGPIKWQLRYEPNAWLACDQPNEHSSTNSLHQLQSVAGGIKLTPMNNLQSPLDMNSRIPWSLDEAIIDTHLCMAQKFNDFPAMFHCHQSPLKRILLEMALEWTFPANWVWKLSYIW